MPTIQTYEAHKQRTDVRQAQRNPKAFWMRQIVEVIEGNRPMLSKPLKDPLVVTVDFVVGRDGHIQSKSIKKSSGVAIIDKLGLDIIDHSAPFPPMPTTMLDAQMAFAIPIRFH